MKDENYVAEKHEVFRIVVIGAGTEFEVSEVKLPTDKFELRIVQTMLDKLMGAIEEALEGED